MAGEIHQSDIMTGVLQLKAMYLKKQAGAVTPARFFHGAKKPAQKLTGSMIAREKPRSS